MRFEIHTELYIHVLWIYPVMGTRVRQLAFKSLPYGVSLWMKAGIIEVQ